MDGNPRGLTAQAGSGDRSRCCARRGGAPQGRVWVAAWHRPGAGSPRVGDGVGHLDAGLRGAGADAQAVVIVHRPTARAGVSDPACCFTSRTRPQHGRPPTHLAKHNEEASCNRHGPQGAASARISETQAAAATSGGGGFVCTAAAASDAQQLACCLPYAPGAHLRCAGQRPGRQARAGRRPSPLGLPLR